MDAPRSRFSRRAPTRRALALSGALALGLLVGATPLATSASTPYGSNLVKNPGAQNGLTAWETFPPSDFETHAYGPGGLGFPSKGASKAIQGGSRFFYAGLYDSAYGTCGDAQQEVKLKGVGSAVDQGRVKVKVKGYAGTNESTLVTAHLDVYFRDGRNHTVAKNGITRSVSGTDEKYKRLKGASILPKKTRILRIHMWADGDATVSSGDCQAFWDNVSITLKRR
jgi:hypothetical protein